MPWETKGPMDQKIKLIADWKSGYFAVSDLRKKYSISRKTVYKWVGRYENEGIDGLKERSRTPRHHPNQTDDRLVKMLLEEKRAYSKWGPKKIVALLEKKYPNESWPAVSTIGEWFKKHGLVRCRKLRKRVPPYTKPFAECNAPNDVWSADYKGQFKTQDGKICYPLTITDNKSRYLLACEGLRGPRYQESRQVFIRVFREYGLPLALRVDNGTPFTGLSIGGLSRLQVWWIKLGIRPERIDKGKPSQNGRHERMHRTLKDDTVRLPGKDLLDQQEKFDWFNMEYNQIRPHEALGQRPPAKLYTRSSRPYTENPPSPEYDLSLQVRSVRSGGEIKFGGELYFVSELLVRERIGLQEIADDMWCIYFSFQPLGILNLRRRKVEPLINNKQVLPMSPV